MAKTLIALKDELQQSFVNLLGLLTALGQLAFLAKLFSDETLTSTVYVTSLALFCAMAFLFARSYLKVRSLAARSKKRKIHKALYLLYLVCMLLALFPAGYRWWYIHYPHEPQEEPDDPVIGKLLLGVMEVRAAELQGALELNMSLDSLRTSFQCSKTRSNQNARAETFSVSECAEYSIPSYRLKQLMHGHGLDESSAWKEDFDRLYPSGTMMSAFQSLKTIATYRGIHEPLLDRGPIIMFLFSKNPAWKKTLLDAKLLPNASEWERLTKEYPEHALALRKFIIEWVGWLDPLFHLSFRNTTSTLIEVSTIRYTADARRGGAGQATLIGAGDNPRYLVEIEEGPHDAELQPPVVVPANGIKEIDLLLRLKRPDPQITYDLKLDFLSAGARSHIALPLFGVTFVRNR